MLLVAVATASNNLLFSAVGLEFELNSSVKKKKEKTDWLVLD